MQTILGSNGVIGRDLAKILPKYTDKIRLVSRNPKKVNPSDEIFSADVTNAEQTLKAVEGSDVVYLTVGLKYDINIWRELWPKIMQNVISACEKNNSKLVFFDNVYSYGKVDGWMKEDAPYKPISQKGEVRVKIAEMLMNEVKSGKLKGMIVRAADFYGPNAQGVLNATVLDNYKKGKKAMWLVNDRVKHSLTYTPDAAKATAILGNTDDAYDQVWHLPTDKNALTGKELIGISAKEFGVEPKYTVLKKWILQVIGMFNKIIKESTEMLYQNEYDYLFDSIKFEKRFGIKATTYQEGIKETARLMKSH
jgi:nucleoside-diphosphate-sugar epimerase